MVQVTGKFKFEKLENMEQYLKEIGMSDEFSKKLMQLGTTVDVFEEGTKYKIVTSYGLTLEFSLNVEFEEPMIKGLKSIAKRNGNKLVITSKLPDGSTNVRSYEFSDTGMTAELTLNNITAKRYYTRI